MGNQCEQCESKQDNGLAEKRQLSHKTIFDQMHDDMQGLVDDCISINQRLIDKIGLLPCKGCRKQSSAINEGNLYCQACLDQSSRYLYKQNLFKYDGLAHVLQCLKDNNSQPVYDRLKKIIFTLQRFESKRRSQAAQSKKHRDKLLKCLQQNRKDIHTFLSDCESAQNKRLLNKVVVSQSELRGLCDQITDKHQESQSHTRNMQDLCDAIESLLSQMTIKTKNNTLSNSQVYIQDLIKQQRQPLAVSLLSQDQALVGFEQKLELLRLSDWSQQCLSSKHTAKLMSGPAFYCQSSKQFYSVTADKQNYTIQPFCSQRHEEVKAMAHARDTIYFATGSKLHRLKLEGSAQLLLTVGQGTISQLIAGESNLWYVADSHWIQGINLRNNAKISIDCGNHVPRLLLAQISDQLLLAEQGQKRGLIKLDVHGMREKLVLNSLTGELVPRLIDTGAVSGGMILAICRQEPALMRLTPLNFLYRKVRQSEPRQPIVQTPKPTEQQKSISYQKNKNFIIK